MQTLEIVWWVMVWIGGLATVFTAMWLFFTRENEDQGRVLAMIVPLFAVFWAATLFKPEYVGKPSETLSEPITRKWESEKAGGGMIFGFGIVGWIDGPAITKHLIATKDGEFLLPEETWRTVKVGDQIKVHIDYDSFTGKSAVLEQ